MKKLIMSSTDINAHDGYGKHFTYAHGKKRFSVYTWHEDDPENFQCQVNEIHPYDLTEYAWAKKDSPSSATVYRSGKRIGYIWLNEYNPENFEDDNEYFDYVIDTIAINLPDYNKNIEPRIDHT